MMSETLQPSMIMETRFVPSFVLLSVAVAVFASYVALNLAHSITHSKGKARVAWLAGGALAMGFGIWSMHFVGMLAFEMPGMEMAYDIPLLILSVVVAIAASALALYVVSRPHVLFKSLALGGTAMAAAICGMHYIGMFSMRMAARIQWDLPLVFLSILIALIASFAALLISIRLRNKPDRFVLMIFASIIMGVAIAGMHYVGMLAATFIHDNSIVIHSSNLLVSTGLSIAVLSTTLLILGLALAGSVGQRLWMLKTKETEDVLVTTEERFRLLVEAVKDYAIFILDLNGVITTWNSGAERITGYSDEEIIGKHVSTVYTSDDRIANADVTELKTAREQGHFEGEVIRIRKDGTKFWANIAITPLYENGKITGFSKVIRDITALKEAEWRMKTLNEELEKRVHERTLALQEREAQLRTITNSLPALIAQVDRNEHFLFANEAFCNWFHFGNAEIIGLSFKDVLNDRYPANEPFIKQALSGTVTTYERHSVIGEKEADLSITLVPEVDDTGHVKGIIVLASNITKHKEIEAELKAAKEEAEVANATKSAFLANMSHEIRTPLGVVLGFSELLLSEDMTASEKLNNMEIIKRNGKMLSSIINDILDLSKVEAGKLEIEKTDVPFTEFLDEMKTLLSLESNGKGIGFSISTEGPIPVILKTDPTRLRQILFNVIGNAIKFTEKGSVDTTVRMIPVRGQSAKIEFTVKDTGHGIGPHQAAKLFSPFTQADASMTRKFGGTGLGLVLSKKLAQALGGDVKLKQSTLSKGSTFVVTIDSGHAENIIFEDATHQQNEENHPSSSFEDLPKLANVKILIIDDSIDVQLLIKKFLTLAAATVETARNAKEGVSKALNGDFNVVLMDLQMPEMDGYEAVRELKSLGFSHPVIAMTAHAIKSERQKCLQNGFAECLTKPIDRKLLLQTLSEHSIH